MDISSILRLSNQVEVEYSAFLNELDKLEVLEYPTIACGELISELSEQGLKNKNTIINIRQELLSATPPINEQLYIKRIKIERRKLIEKLTCFLDWINGAQTQKVPWSFVPTIERIAKQIIPDNHPILYCKNQYNYEIRWYRQISEELDEYSFISLPRLHKKNILMHTLLGHELFHPCCEEFTDKYKNEVAKNIITEVQKAFPGLSPDNLFGKKRLDQINDYLLHMWKFALHELLCDMFCAKIFGPAALLAMRSLASFSDWKTKPEEANFYPPFQYRFEIVWQNAIDKDALSKLWGKHSEIQGILNSFELEIEDFGATLKSDKGFKFVCESNLTKTAYIEVKKMVSQAHDYVVSKLPDSMSKWTDEKVLNQVPKLVDRLQNGIPPNEIPDITLNSGTKDEWNYKTESAELPAILMAGWMYQVYREKNMENDNLLSYDTLSRLLLKACEDSEMLRYG